jgi:hypothetical protein
MSMGTFLIGIERSEEYEFEVEAGSLAEAERRAEELKQEMDAGETNLDILGVSTSPARISKITPPRPMVWHCPGCGWVTDEGGDVPGHVRDCDLVDGMGRAIREDAE